MVDYDISTFFNNIYDSTHRKILVYITAKCSDTVDISDIFQDTYMEFYRILLKRGSSYVKNSEALLMKIAKQKISRYYSKMDKIKSISFLKISTKINNEATYTYPADEFNLEETVINNELIGEVRMFLNKKPEVVKKIFYLFYYLDTTIPQIASLLSVSESYVKNKLYRTLKELRKLYQ